MNVGLHVPFGIAGGVQDVARNVLVAVELEDGTRGFGEAAPLPAYNGETQEQALTALVAAGERLAAWAPEPAGWRELSHAFRRETGGASGSAQCGFETALLDAWSRHQGISLAQFFGGAAVTLETDVTIPTGTAEAAGRAAADFSRQGFCRLKVKIGGARPEHDLRRITEIVAAAPGASLILDGNAGLSRADAAVLVQGLRAQQVWPAVLEQWLAKDDLAGLRALADESGWVVAADESVVTPADALRVAHARAAQVINVKLMKAGVATALDVIEVATRAGLGLMIGGNVETTLGMTMSACLASGRGGFCHIDLDTPLFLADHPLGGGLRYEGARIDLSGATIGHGVRPVAG